MLKPEHFFDLSESQHKGIFSHVTYVWEVLTNLKAYIKDNITANVSLPSGVLLSKTFVIWHDEVITGNDLDIKPGDTTKGGLRVFRGGKALPEASVLYAGSTLFDGDIQIGKGTVIEPGALIKGPTIIGDHTEVRQGAYVRGNCLIGDRCIVGHTTEMKSAIMLNDAKAGHFAYIGDSILGNAVNLGAGTKLANLKIVDFEMVIRVEGKEYKTGLRKLGAILGDNVQTGCNSVTSPGTLLGKNSLVYPCVNVSGGYHPNRSIIGQRKKPGKRK